MNKVHTVSVVFFQVLKISGVYIIPKSHGRDSGRCGTFTTAVLEQTITTTAVLQHIALTTALQHTITTVCNTPYHHYTAVLQQAITSCTTADYITLLY